jgi:colanic acid/amylovoran biosynthesis protein
VFSGNTAHSDAVAPAGRTPATSVRAVRGGPEVAATERGLRVALMGAPIGIGNRGVSALGASLVRLVLGVRGDARISLLMGSRKPDPIELRVGGQVHVLPVINYRMSPKAALQEQLWWIALLAALHRIVPSRGLRSRLESSNRWIAAVARADFVGEIRGGDSFSDIYGVWRFVLGSLPLLTALWVKREVVLLPQTYGPYKSRIARWLARHILLRAQAILTRDRAGLAVVRQLTRGRREAVFCPDVAFALEVAMPANPGIVPPLAQKDSVILVGLNVNGLMFNGGYTRSNMFGLKLDYRAFLDELLRMLLDIPGVHILLVPHTYAAAGSVESDNDACRMLAERVPAGDAMRVHVVTEEHDQYHIKGVIGLCDFFVGSRMHACIAALSQGIPTVGVAYSRKFAGVFASVGADEWVVDGRDTDAVEAVQRIRMLLDRRQTLRQGLAAEVARAEEILSREFGNLVKRGSTAGSSSRPENQPHAAGADAAE